jgi:AcrR family transcriptional regulator
VRGGRIGTVEPMDGADLVRRPPFGNSPHVGQRGSATQRKILSAAMDIFGEHGFHGARVEQITEAAGCSRPSFYQYFSSKDDVFWRLAGDLATEMAALAKNLGNIPPDAEGVERLRGWLDALIDLHVAYEPLFQVFQAAQRTQGAPARSTRNIPHRMGQALFRSAASDHEEPDRLGTITVITLLRSIHYWRIGLGEVTRERFVDGSAQMIHRLLHGRLDGVNVAPLTKPPVKRPPRFPDPPPTRDRPLRPRGRRTRQNLLDAGAAALPRRGYHGTRIDDIVESAGLSHACFYRYFSNKDDLFHVLAKEAADRMVELVGTFPSDSSADALRTWLQGWFRAYRANGGVISVWQEINFTDPDLATFALEVALVAFDRLVRIISERGFGDPAVDALALLSVLERVPHSVLVLDYLSEDSAVEASITIIRQGLLGVASPT